ncbi:MAG: MoxR family ATPase [Lachnospiraceae bacterium]|nr:MoxR family ATPase [Lachnospiraceae bacterium]MDD3616635.1 MoxR family ATPase [Lachnospiraceae bacterium]
MDSIVTYLKEQDIDEGLIADLMAYRDKYEVDEQVLDRVDVPDMLFYGKRILEMSIAALLEEENLLLSGAKATGKNVLCETLAYLFGRPSYNISFHVNTDSASLIGTDTFKNNEVQLRTGPIYQCAQYGGFGVLDEINMAKNDAVSVLHATLDHRRVLDVPGYVKISLHPAARFIGTMNYGYAGTKELNEALVSRFMVVDMPPLDEETIHFLLKKYFESAKKEAVKQFTGLFLDLQTKAYNGEISTKSLDLRGLISSMKTIRSGLLPVDAIRMGIVNKSFDVFEKEIIEDVAMTRIPAAWTRADIFEG